MLFIMLVLSIIWILGDAMLITIVFENQDQYLVILLTTTLILTYLTPVIK